MEKGAEAAIAAPPALATPWFRGLLPCPGTAGSRQPAADSSFRGRQEAVGSGTHGRKRSLNASDWV